MKIINLQSENIKRIRAIEIEPDGAIVRITGKNANGKTSVLDSILYALGGEREIPSKPIRQGAKKAHISVDLGNMVVDRNFTQKGSYLKVTSKDGKAISSPQKMLDNLVGRLSFDPLSFSRENPKKQADILRELANLDLSGFDVKEAAMMEERRLAAIAGQTLAARLGAMETPSDNLPEQMTDVLVLQNRITQATKDNAVIDDAERHIAAITEDAERLAIQLRKAKDLVASLDADISRYKAEAVEAAEERVLLGDKQDISEMAQQMNMTHATNHAIETAAAWRELSDEVKAARENLREQVNAIESLREERADIIAAATYPLEGLGISDEGEVLFNSLPLAQASLSEQLKISTAVAMALNPELRVLRITDGSLLDTDSMAVIEDLAKDNDYQVWIEQVDETGEVGFYIEDGTLATIEGEKQDAPVERN